MEFGPIRYILEWGPPKDYFCQIWFILADLFQRTSVRLTKKTKTKKNRIYMSKSSTPCSYEWKSCFGPFNNVFFFSVMTTILDEVQTNWIQFRMGITQGLFLTSMVHTGWLVREEDSLMIFCLNMHYVCKPRKSTKL